MVSIQSIAVKGAGNILNTLQIEHFVRANYAAKNQHKSTVKCVSYTVLVAFAVKCAVDLTHIYAHHIKLKVIL